MPDVSLEVKQEALAIVQNTTIEANFDEVKAALTEMMLPYQSMVVSEDGISAAKSDRARIRKVASGIDDLRKTVKRAYSEPLKAFEDKCKELVAICDSGAANLDRQVKEYEQREADAKISRLHDFYENSGTAEEREYCPWESIVNARWANKGVSEESAQSEILAKLNATGQDLATIRTLDERDVPYLLDYYKGNQDVREVIRKSTELKARREAEEQRRAQQERAKREADERRTAEIERLQEQNTADAEESTVSYGPSAVEEPAEEVHQGNERLSIVFRATGTREQFQQLKVFMQSLGMGLYRV